MIFTIQVLTPIHIGSGEEYLEHYRYVYFPQEGKIGLLDEAKVLNLLGKDTSLINQWVSVLDKGESFLDFLKKNRQLKFDPEDICQRLIPMHGPGPSGNQGGQQPIRAQIFSGSKPMIPGSSLKGAIRTVILTQYIDEDDGSHFYNNKSNVLDGRGNFTDTSIQKKLLGKDPNHDMFRLLLLGDSSFDQSICTLAKSMNYVSRKGWEEKKSIQQYIECIPIGATSSFRMNFNHFLADADGKYKTRDFRNQLQQPGFLFSKNQKNDLKVDQLFFFINQHTQILIENELTFWKEDFSYPSEVSTYLEVLNGLNDQLTELVEKRDKHSCILRLGWGTGFKNITGDWQPEKFSEQMFEKLVKALRPKHPIELPYPKTRRMTWEGVPFGFIKIEKTP